MLLIVVSIPRRMIKIACTPRTELYKIVITKGCDHTISSFDPSSYVTKDSTYPSYGIIQKCDHEEM